MDTSTHSRGFYNSKTEDAYNQMLADRRSERSAQISDSDDSVSADFSNEMLDFSNSSSHSDLGVNEDYEHFKTSLLQDDWGEPLEDDDDEDYTEEADQSFIMESDAAEALSRGPDYHIKSFSTWIRGSLVPLVASLVVVVLAIMVLAPGGSPQASEIQNAVPGTNAQLRTQLNSLYREFQEEKKAAKKDLDNAIKLIILQVEKHMKQLLPRDLGSVSSQLRRLDTQVQDLSQSLSLNNVTEWQESLMHELERLLPDQIPVVLDNSTNALMVVPELHRYLAEVIPQAVNRTLPRGLAAPFNYDAGQYVREILRDEYEYVDKSDFLRELDSALRVNKEDILREMEARISTLENVPQQYSNVLQRKLIHKIYNANQHQWQDDVDFATVAQGTRILNHLCSSTFKGHQGIPPNGVSPLDLLADTPAATSTYWLCKDKRATGSCSWAMHFAQPLYLTRISYLHGRFTNNLHLMNSAPKSIAVYVKLQSPPTAEFQRIAAKHGQGAVWDRDNSFVEIGSWDYDVSDARIRQYFLLPPWFVQCKPQVRSLALVVRSNHGNTHYTALRKFVINAVTAQDLQLSSTYAQQRQFEIPEYASPFEDRERSRASQIAAWQRRGPSDADPAIPSFGQDEYDR